MASDGTYGILFGEFATNSASTAVTLTLTAAIGPEMASHFKLKFTGMPELLPLAQRDGINIMIGNALRLLTSLS